MKFKYIVYIVIFIASVIAFSKFWLRTKEVLNIEANTPIVFSEKSMLKELWNAYKKEYIEPVTFRTIDKQKNNITTSEGQSYTMFRAVLMDDKEVFDNSWKWTKDILKKKDINLFSWLFGLKADGSYGILEEQGGNNSATDADSDIALALIFANLRWKDSEYLEQARLILNDLWENSVITIDNKPYLLANNLEKKSVTNPIVNPSYFAPYAYRIFSDVDKVHPWMEVVTTSYEVLNASTVDPIDKQLSANIPPDWIYLDRNTGNIIRTYENQSLKSDYSFDAMRVPWRIALDWFWYQEPKAKEYLEKLNFLSEEWLKNNKILANYSHDGMPLTTYESHAMYGNLVGALMITKPDLAEQIYKQKLEILYSPDNQSWVTTLSYYDDNWAWLGMAMYNSELPNLYSK